MFNQRLLFLLLVSIVLGSVAWGQVKPATPSVQAKKQAVQGDADDDDDDDAGKLPESALPRDTAVLTITGFCPQAKQATQVHAPATCQTIVTRAAFERLSNTLKSDMSAQHERQLAAAYPKLLVMAEKAHERGLDKGPRFEELMRFSRLQILSRELVREIEEESAKITDQEAQQFYESHPEMFEQVSLERIFVPRAKRIPRQEQKANSDPRAEQKLAEDEMTKAAEELRSRAAAGEDFTHLQKEAFSDAGIQSDPPSAAMEKVRQTGLPPAHASVMKLKVGEVSQVISDSSGHYIYKLDAKDLIPLSTARKEITDSITRQRVQSEMQEIEHSFSTKVNEEYFHATAVKPPKDDITHSR